MSYVWVIARRHIPVRFWAIGSTLMACGALLVGLRDVAPLFVSVFLGHALVIFGWLMIDAGIVIAGRRRPPWRVAIAIALLMLFGAYWFLLVQPDFSLRSVAVSLPGVLFDSYAASACLRARVGRRTTTLRILAMLLLLTVASNLLKTAFIFVNDTQVLFASDWQISQFYLVSVIATVVGAVLFVLLAAQRLQDKVDRELEERKQAEKGLREALIQAERFRMALDNVPAYVYMKDQDLHYTYANRPTLELFGCTRDELLGADDGRFFPPDTVRRLREVDRLVLSGENTKTEIDVPDSAWGHRVYFEVKTPVFSDRAQTRIAGLCGISTDITAIREHQAQLEYVAHYDSLTGLPNRLLFFDRLDQALVQSRRRGSLLAVLFLDLDGFKAINDAHGHDAGDSLLIAISRRMTDVLRQGDSLARLGGDEFVAILVDLESEQDCAPVLERLLRAVSEPVTIGPLSVQVSVSIGVTIFPEDASDADLLLRHADQAMYCAKQAGKNCFRRFSVVT